MESLLRSNANLRRNISLVSSDVERTPALLSNSHNENFTSFKSQSKRKFKNDYNKNTIRSDVLNVSEEEVVTVNSGSAAVNVASSSTERCPVTWNSSLVKKKMQVHMQKFTDFTLPSPTTKVQTWIASNDLQNNMDDVMSLNQKLPFTEIHLDSLTANAFGKYSKDQERRSFILARQDYISDTNNINTAEKGFSTRNGITSHSSIEPSHKSSTSGCFSQPKVINSHTKNGQRPKNTAVVEVKLSSSEQNDVKEIDPVNKSLKQTTSKHEEIPLSPESQKKKELCSYLQLMNMNPVNKASDSTFQNRRSTRVKNLILLSEKKELERQLNNEAESIRKAKEKISDNSDQPPSGSENQSDCVETEKLVVKLNKFEINLEQSMTKKNLPNVKMNMSSIHKSLSFTNVPVLYSTTADFDDTMKTFLKHENCNGIANNTRKSPSAVNQECKKSAHPKRNNVTIGLKEKKCKKQVTITLNKMNLAQVRRYTRSRVKSSHVLRNSNMRNLRSKGRLKHVGVKSVLGPSFVKKSKTHKPEGSKRTLKLSNYTRRYSKTESTRENTNLLNETEPLCFPKTSPEHTKKLFESKMFQSKNQEQHSLSALDALTPKQLEDIILAVSETVTDDIPTSKNQEMRENCNENPDYFDIASHSQAGSSSPCYGFQKAEVYSEDIDKLNVVFSRFTGSSNIAKTQETNTEDLLFRNHSDLTISVPDSNTPEHINIGLSEPYFIPNTLRKSRISDAVKILSSVLNMDTDIPSESAFEADKNSSTHVTSTEKFDTLFGTPEIVNPTLISPLQCNYIPLNSGIETKSLHRNLMQPKRKNYWRNDLNSESSLCNLQKEELSPRSERKSSHSHSIYISGSDGPIISAFYVDFNLVIAQELLVSFWSQSALGNMLGVQNMWVPKGNVHRLVLDNGCEHTHSAETIISMENSVAYVELWTKEHKSDKRERPVADVFATIYFWKLRRNGPEKKVLQLENINGYSSDVRYVVTRSSRDIIVSWNVSAIEKTTLVHCYRLASDYQTVESVKEIQSVNHYVSSLHNVEDCDSVVMGCGEHKVTLWNLEYGYVVATVDELDVRPQPTTLYVKCDRGFLFMVQHFYDDVLQLVAVNGINYGWKRLQLYKPPGGYSSLRGICMENGILVAFYENGIVCWNSHSGDLIEEIPSDTAYFPSGNHVIMVVNDQIHVRHALAYVIANYDT